MVEGAKSAAATEAEQRIINNIADYIEGGALDEAMCWELVATHGLHPKWLKGIIRDAKKARAEFDRRVAEEQAKLAEQLKPKAEAKPDNLFGERYKKPKEEKPKEDKKFSEGNAQSEQKATEPEPEIEEEPVPGVSLWPYFQRAGEDKAASTNLPVISKTAILDNARTFARRKCWRDGKLATVHWHGKFWRWNGRVYAEWPEAEVRVAVTQFLDQSYTLGETGKARYIPKPKDPAALIEFLRDGLAIGEGVDPPIWFGSGFVDRNLMVFKNKIVDIETLDEVDPSPALWIHTSVDYEWLPDAECPVWDRFIEEVFPGDEESQRCVEEQIGLAMTGDLSFEKGLMLIGQTRSGKSTITKVANELVGGTSYVSLDPNRWLSKPTSAEVLIGKRLGVFEDMRLRPAKWYGANLDPGGLDHASVEMLLKLTSGNNVTVGRIYRNDWQGVVPVHLWIVSNEVPTLNDAVLPGRFVKLAFNESFYGREDVGLKAKLCGELPGIAQRAVAAYRAAKERGWLIQPKAGNELKADVDAASDIFLCFVRDRIVLDGNASVKCSKLHDEFELWCSANNQESLMRSIPDASKLTKKLKSKVPGLAKLETTSNHPREYLGLRLRGKEDR